VRISVRFSIVLGLVTGGIAPALLAQDLALPPLEEQVIEQSSSVEALGLVQNYMKTVRSLKADFIQLAPGGNQSNGTLYLARPGKIRFDYAGDVPFLVVSDGEVINFVDYEIGQVTKVPVSDTPLRALFGDTFDVTGMGAHIEQLDIGDQRFISLTATMPNQPEAGEITVYFERSDSAPSGLILRRWLVLDAQGQQTAVLISGNQTNVELASSLWKFKDPRGLAKRPRRRR